MWLRLSSRTLEAELGNYKWLAQEKSTAMSLGEFWDTAGEMFPNLTQKAKWYFRGKKNSVGVNKPPHSNDLSTYLLELLPFRHRACFWLC